MQGKLPLSIGSGRFLHWGVPSEAHASPSSATSEYASSSAQEAITWMPWCVDLRQETFQVIRDVLSYCTESLRDQVVSMPEASVHKVQHLALFTLWLLRANIVQLCRAVQAEAPRQNHGSLAPNTQVFPAVDLDTRQGQEPASPSILQSPSPSPNLMQSREDNPAANHVHQTASGLLRSREILDLARILRGMLTKDSGVLGTIQFE